MSFKDVFFSLFPNAPKDVYGYPKCTMSSTFGITDMYSDIDRRKQWDSRCEEGIFQ